MPRALEFFAGSGLVAEAIGGCFKVAWANDVSPRKADVYRANHGSDRFVEGPIERVRGADLPDAELSWASFPCQDLSLAGNLNGIRAARSGLVWHWLRIMDEMRRRPPLLAAENVQGLLSASKGEHYDRLHRALRERGYRAGAVVLDAVRWVPQSRPRVFVIAVDERIAVEGLVDDGASWCHTPASLRAARRHGADWTWWRIPAPSGVRPRLENLIDFDAPCDDERRRAHNLSLIPERHLRRIEDALNGTARVFPGYKRTRGGRQVLELRFDGVAGCLRTPEGGSSRQLLVLWRGRRLETRLLTVPETAALMGAGARFKIPGRYNDGYKAMGDAVAVPVVRHLARRLLAPLARRLG